MSNDIKITKGASKTLDAMAMAAGEWYESKHPRGKDGKFVPGDRVEAPMWGWCSRYRQVR